MTRHSSEDACISYGRGGAGNMRRRSSIRESWFKVMAAGPSPLVLTSSPEDHYAASKTEPRRRSTVSSTWSTSTAGKEHGHGSGSMWRRWLGRRKESTSVEEGVEEDKVVDSDVSTAEEPQIQEAGR